MKPTFRRIRRKENKDRNTKRMRIGKFRRAFESRITTGILTISAVTLFGIGVQGLLTRSSSSTKVECEGRPPTTIDERIIGNLVLDSNKCKVKVCTKETVDGKEECKPATFENVEKANEIGKQGYDQEVASGNKVIGGVFLFVFAMVSFFSRKTRKMKERVFGQKEEPKEKDHPYVTPFEGC